VHTELAERAGISIDWAATDKVEYLTALTREMDSPGKGHLDAYLKPFVGVAIGRDGLASHVARAPGLDGNAQNEVLGKFSDPVLQARYRHQEEQRSGGILSADLRGAKRGTGETASPQEQDKGRSR
jgi:cell filamentation protein